jgi:hypothetical protein
MKRITVFLTEQQITTLQEMAIATGLKFAELLRRVVDAGLALQKERQPSRKSCN